MKSLLLAIAAAAAIAMWTNAARASDYSTPDQETVTSTTVILASEAATRSEV